MKKIILVFKLSFYLLKRDFFKSFYIILMFLFLLIVFDLIYITNSYKINYIDFILNNTSIEVFFDPLVDSNYIKEFIDSLTNKYKLEQIEIVTKQDAFSYLKSKFKDLKVVSIDILPMSVVLIINKDFNYNRLNKLLHYLKSRKNVIHISYNKGLLLFLKKFDKYYHYFFISFISLLSIIGIFFIYNNIYHYTGDRDEFLETFNELGYSKYYIKLSYFINFLILSLISNLIIAFFMYKYYYLLNNIINKDLWWILKTNIYITLGFLLFILFFHL